MNQEESQIFDPGALIRRGLFFVLMLGLSLIYLFLLFRGLSNAEGMDQAQIAREISRNNGFSTKFIRPIAYAESVAAPDAKADFINFRDTNHAPLNLLVNAAIFKLIDAGDAKKWALKDKEQMIYSLDRWVAGISIVFFILSIGVTYLLIGRIFDTKIAGVTAMLMVCCELMWNYSLSGLPQMLMLFLFSSGCYFAYLALESTNEGRSSITPAITAGLFFVLLALSHWICVWILIGYIIIASVIYRPRGIIAITTLAIAAVLFAYPLWRNYQASGSFLGAAYYGIFSGLGSGEDAAMRATEIGGVDTSLRFQGVMLKIFRTIIVQATDLLPFLGSIFAAPVFFVALIHQFKSSSISTFRWGILLMWCFAAIGMSIFGVSTDALHPNQIHILFAPIMAAYGVAFLTILWTRLEIVKNIPVLTNAHLWVLVLLGLLPLLSGTYEMAEKGLKRGEKGFPQWPPYFPPALSKLGQNDAVDAKSITVSDQPWAVAWYADRMSIWLPKKVESFEKLEIAASARKTPFSGILITPTSHGHRSMINIAEQYDEFTALCINGRVGLSTLPSPVSILEKAPKLSGIANKYRYRVDLLNLDMNYYSNVQYKIVE